MSRRNFEQVMINWGSWQYTDRKAFLRELLSRSCVPTRLRATLLVTVLKGHSLRSLTTDNISNVHNGKWQAADRAKVFPLLGSAEGLTEELLRTYAVVEGEGSLFVPFMRKLAQRFVLLVVASGTGAGDDDPTEGFRDVCVRGFWPGVSFMDVLEAFHSLLHNPFHRAAELFVGGSFFLTTLCNQLTHFVALHLPEVLVLLRGSQRVLVAECPDPSECGPSNKTNRRSDGDLLFLACHQWFLTLFDGFALDADLPLIWLHFACFGWKFMLSFALQLLSEATVNSEESSAIAIDELPDEMLLDAVVMLPSCVTDIDATIRRARKWYAVLATSVLLRIERQTIEECNGRHQRREQERERARASELAAQRVLICDPSSRHEARDRRLEWETEEREAAPDAVETGQQQQQQLPQHPHPQQQQQHDVASSAMPLPDAALVSSGTYTRSPSCRSDGDASFGSMPGSEVAHDGNILLLPPALHVDV